MDLFSFTPPALPALPDLPFTPSRGAARHTDPETSKAAAENVDATRLEEMVLDALQMGPKTAHELAAHTGLPLNTISPRTAPLQRKKRIRDSGERRKFESSRAAIVWELCPGE